MFTQIEESGRQKAIDGAIAIGKVVTSTMGPHGSTVALSAQGQHPITSKDGKNVGMGVLLEDEAERVGATFMQEGMNRQADEAGDATTTMTQMAMHMLQNLPDIGRRQLMQELTDAATVAVEVVKAMKLEVKESDVDTLAKIATTSVNNDPILGRMVAELVSEVGKEGIIYIDADPKAVATTSEVQRGYHMNKGVFSKHLLNGLVANIHDPVIVVTEDVINEGRRLQPILEMYVEKYGKGGKFSNPLVIVASMVVGSALEMLNKNASSGIPVIAIQAESFEALQDISAITGAFLFGEQKGRPLYKVGEKKHFGKETDNVFGRASKVTAAVNYSTIFFDPTDAIDAHIASLVDSPERKAKLTKGVGKITVGGPIESERTDIAQLLEDAEQSCFAALRDGYLPGGGTALMEASNHLFKTTGGRLLAGAMLSVFTKLCDHSEVIPETAWKEGEVFNFKTMQFEPEETTSVLDSVKSITSAITNAVAVVKQIIQLKYSVITFKQ